MRFDGTLNSWNDTGGFGFIRPAKGGQDIFAHISAFPTGAARPTVGEPLSFEVEVNHDGKKRAKAVQRPQRAVLKPQDRETRSGSWSAAIAAVALLIGVAALVRYLPALSALSATRGAQAVGVEAAPPLPASLPAARAPYSCDGRTRCTQVHSCAEATWVSNNCPGTKMDGDHDGVPCEEQWCRRERE